MSQIQYQHGEYPDLIGRRSCVVGNLAGPASYVTGGDPVQVGQFNYYIDLLISGALTVSGNYYGRAIPSGPLPRATWKMKWYTAGTDTEVSANTNLSAETMIVGVIGGLF
jgi:hypothetical protein